MNRFRNEYRSRFFKTESSQQNQFDREFCNNEKAVIEELFEDIVDATINTVPPRPVAWSTPVGSKSDTPPLSIKEAVQAPTSSDTYMKSQPNRNKSRSTESQVYHSPESRQACNLLQKDHCGSLVETNKNNHGPEKQTPDIIVDTIDEGKEVYIAKGNSILVEEDISEAPPNPEICKKPADYLYSFDQSAVHEPSSPTVKVQARKRLSFKDKETSCMSRIKASEMCKEIQPEDKIKTLMLTSRSIQSANRMLESDAEPRNNLHRKEITGIVTKENEAEKVEKTKAGSKVVTAFLENDEFEMLCPSEKPKNKFVSMLFKAAHSQQRLSVLATQPHSPSNPPSPLTTINSLEEEFVIDEADSCSFASWERDLKKVKPSGQLSKNAAYRKRRLKETISSHAYTSICSFYQTSLNNENLFAATSVNILPSSKTENKVIVEKYQIRQTFTGEKDQCQAHSGPLAVNKPGEPDENNAVLLTDNQMTLNESHVSSGIPSLVEVPSDLLNTKKIVHLGGDVFKEKISGNFKANLKKNSVTFKTKLKSKKAVSQTLSKTLKKKRVVKVVTLEKASLEMQTNSENACNDEAGTWLPPTENHCPISSPSNGDSGPIMLMEKIPRQSLTNKVVTKPNVKILKKPQSVSNIEDHTKDPSDDGGIEPKTESTKISSASLNKHEIKVKRSRNNKKGSSPGIRLLETNLALNSFLKENENGKIPMSVERDLNHSENKNENNINLKNQRRRRPPSAWWAVNPEQDLLTKQKEYLETRKKSPKKVQTMEQFVTPSLKNVTLLSPPFEGILENKVGCPSSENEIHQYVNEGKCSDSKRKRQPTAIWWAVNPEKEFLPLPRRSKKTVSRKISRRFSEKRRCKKEAKATNIPAKIALSDKINKTDALCVNASENRLIKKAAKHNGSKLLVFLNENAEEKTQSEKKCHGKKRKINEANENSEPVIPDKKGKSILKASSRKYEIPVSDEKHMEEEREEPQTSSIFAVPKKVESRVSVLRKSLCQSARRKRLSSFKGSLEGFGAVYSKTPIASKGNRHKIETKLISPKKTPTRSLIHPNNSLNQSFSVVGPKKGRMILYSDESESGSVNEHDFVQEDNEHLSEEKVCDDQINKKEMSAKTTLFHLKKPFVEDGDILTETIHPCANGNKLHQKANFSKVTTALDFVKPTMNRKNARGLQQKGNCLQIEEVLQESPEPTRYVKRQEKLLKKVHFPDFSPISDCATIGTPKRTIIGTPRRDNVPTCSQCQGFSDLVNTDKSTAGEMEGIEEICRNQQFSENGEKVRKCSPQKRLFKRLPSSVEKRVNPVVNQTADTVTPTKSCGIFNDRSKVDDPRVVQSGSGQVSVHNVRRTYSRDIPVPFDQHKCDPEVFEGRTTTMPTAVMDPIHGKETHMACVKTLEECTVQSQNGLLAIKSIIQPRFSMGKLILEPLQEKGFNFLQLHTLLFYVVDGVVMATVHFSNYQLKTGDCFFVPPGNIYNIRNLQEDARSSLLFVRLKEDMPVSEDCDHC